MLNKTLLPETVAKINHLLKYLHDSYKGYHESIDTIDDTSLRESFTSTAQKRKEMIKELEGVLLSSNETPEQSSTIMGAAHRIFLDLKSLVTGKDTTAILKEVNRGENMLLKIYKETVVAIDDPEIKARLQKQLDSVQEDLKQWGHTGQ